METLQRTANRGSISTGFDIDNSVKFEADNTEYMKFTSSQSGSDLYRMAFNIWLKRTELGATQTFMLLGNGGSNSTRLDLSFDSSDRLQVRNVNSNWRLTTQVFRDTSAWYHLFFQIDTTQSTADDRIKVWVNGNLIAIADYTTVQDPGLNAVLGFNRNYANILGGREIEGSNSQMFSGYIAQVYGSGGTPPSVTDFGEFDEDTGIWKPKDISGISPPDSVNGFFLDFTDASDLGNDASGNSNDFTLNNITVADQATDTPTNNFATWNVLDVTRTNTQGVDMVEGAMSIKHRGSNGWTGTCSNIAISKGKWYWEAEVRVTNGASMWGAYPVATRQANVFFDIYIGASESDGYDSGAAFYDNDDAYYHDNTFTACTIGGSTFNTQTGDVIMIAVDMDNNKIYAGVNGNWCNSSDDTLPNATGITLSDEPHFLATATYTANTTNSYNFGGFTTDTISSAASDANGYGTFEYAPPSGYYALCTKNLAEYG